MFTFVGAGIDAFAQAGQWGTPTGTTLNASPDHVVPTMGTVAGQTLRYTNGMSAAESSFTGEERQTAMGKTPAVPPPAPAPKPQRKPEPILSDIDL